LFFIIASLGWLHGIVARVFSWWGKRSMLQWQHLVGSCHRHRYHPQLESERLTISIAADWQVGDVGIDFLLYMLLSSVEESGFAKLAVCNCALMSTHHTNDQHMTNGGQQACKSTIHSDNLSVGGRLYSFVMSGLTWWDEAIKQQTGAA
jgi:hypothetical protein